MTVDITNFNVVYIFDTITAKARKFDTSIVSTVHAWYHIDHVVKISHWFKINKACIGSL